MSCRDEMFNYRSPARFLICALASLLCPPSRHTVPSLLDIKSSDSILLAAIGGPKWDVNPRELRPETGLLAMRSQLGLFANLRPAKVCTWHQRVDVFMQGVQGGVLVLFCCICFACVCACVRRLLR